MKTTKKWLIFWGCLILLVASFFAVVLTGNFPQFEIPFDVFASTDKAEKKVELPKLKSIALKDYDDQALLKKQNEKIEAVNERFKDPANYASTEALSVSLGSVFGTVNEQTEVLQVFRTLYPAISSENAQFVKASLLGFGSKLVDDQPFTSQKELWTFTDASGNRHDYQVTFTYNDQILQSVSATAVTNQVTVLTDDDTYLDKAADFETTWDDIVTNASDETVYRQLKKADFNQQLPEFTALKNELPLKEKDGFFDLFKAAQGNLRNVYLTGFFHSNSPTDGQSEYEFSVPTSKSGVAYFTVSYDRLQQKIISITKQ